MPAGIETSADRTPELCLRENELFNATPSPVPAVREEYTPLSKLVDVSQAAGGSVTPLLSAMPQSLVDEGRSSRPWPPSALRMSLRCLPSHAGEAAGCMSPEILGFTECNQAAPALGGTPIAGLCLHTSAQPSPLGRWGLHLTHRRQHAVYRQQDTCGLRKSSRADGCATAGWL